MFIGQFLYRANEKILAEMGQEGILKKWIGFIRSVINSRSLFFDIIDYKQARSVITSVLRVINDMNIMEKANGD